MSKKGRKGIHGGKQSKYKAENINQKVEFGNYLQGGCFVGAKIMKYEQQDLVTCN